MTTEFVKLAVDLLQDSGRVSQSWITRFITINGALAAAVGVIIGINPAGNPYAGILKPVLLAICGIGAASSILITLATLRALAWNRAHTTRVKELSKVHNVELILDKEVSGGIRVQTWMLWAAGLAIAMWALLACLLYGTAIT
jgi:hypothetical protein